MALRGGKAARDHRFCCQIHYDFNKVRKEASHRVSAIAGCPARGLCLPPALKGAGSLLPPQHIFQSSSRALRPPPPAQLPVPTAVPLLFLSLQLIVGFLPWEKKIQAWKSLNTNQMRSW